MAFYRWTTAGELNWGSEMLTASDLNNSLAEAFMPIGSVVGWLKSFTGVPATLPLGWRECDGATISDVDSPYNGVVVPDLNGGTYRFLRGSTTSGTTGGADTHNHSAASCVSGTNTPAGASWLCGAASSTDDGRPSYYEVVWIMRFKGGTTHWNTSGKLVWKAYEIVLNYDLNDAIDTTLAPIGSVVGWLKTLTGTPATLPGGWRECDGSVISDADSPLNTQTLPNLNASGGGTQRFLKGSATSGTTGGAETHTHSRGAASTNQSGGSTYLTSLVAYSSLPQYYEVVWAVRFK